MESGGRGRGEGRGFGERGGRGGGGRGGGGDRRPRRAPGGQDAAWKPVTKLGRLVQQQKIESLEEIFRFSIPIKEFEIVDKLIKAQTAGQLNPLKEEVMQIKPVQKQTCAGQRTRFKAYVCVGDMNGHVGMGWKVAKEVQGAIKGAIIHAKLNIVPIRRGYWGNKIGNAHSIPVKVTGKSGSVRVRLIPAPRGTGLVAAPASKKVLQFAGIGDVYTASRGCTRTKGNFVKATYYALENTYKYLTPDFWGKHKVDEHPFEVHSKVLSLPQAASQEPRSDERGERRQRQSGGQRY